ncbi:deoxyribodipyrimidine photo-lyase [Streptomyces peucetius]|uniref:deoxyribodipyrimidine photo-lyase n=1 Tax=Streptomyces peucetius TaxID=1950 RepID=UPI0039AEBEB9
MQAALRAADEAVPLFVHDPGIRAAGFEAPSRRALPADCLTGLDASLCEHGGRLVARSGRWPSGGRTRRRPRALQTCPGPGATSRGLRGRTAPPAHSR